MIRQSWNGWVLLSVFVLAGNVRAEETSAERGRRALTGRAFYPAAWSAQAFKGAWKFWGGGGQSAPKAYSRAFGEFYGLPPAPYPNGDYPMGLRESRGLLGKGISTDCLLCHGGSILGQSIIGLGNTTVDVQALFEDLSAADGRSPRLPFTFCNVRGTSEAGAMAVYLLGWREPDLSMRKSRLDLGLHDDLCEDVPAWWLLKKKRTMYFTGGGDARSVRSMMQFMLSPLTTSSAFDREESTFADIRAYLRTLQPPRYPFAVDRSRAAQGESLFRQHCSRCHGTYGAQWTYPNKIVPLDVVGTDARRLHGITPVFEAYFRKSWFGREHPGWLADDYPARPPMGYQAPPLDGIWATPPYLHNGSLPTVYDVLNSRSRPALFTRSYRTDADAYDPVKLGWKVESVTPSCTELLPPRERRRVYDTTQPGRGNQGHLFGDTLSDVERMAIIEYLKTI